MPQMKAVLSFAYGQQGFSETYYPTAGTHQTAYDQLSAAGGLIESRRAMMPQDYFIRYLRISDVDTPRDAFFVAFPGNSGQGNFSDADARGEPGSEQPDDAVNLRVFAGRQIWRSFPIRALPKSAFRQDGQLKSAGSFMAALTSFRRVLTVGYTIAHRTRGNTAKLTDLFLSGGKINTLIVDATPFGTVSGSLVQVRRAVGASNVNGFFRVDGAPGAANIPVRTRLKTTYGTIVANTGTVSLITTSYAVITDSVVVGVTERKAGRPLYQPAGRARVQRS